MADAIEKGALAASKAQFIGNVPESSRYGGETIRDKARGALFNLGIDRRGVNTLIGDMRADSIIDNIGLVDLTPVALPAVIQEGARSLKQGDYVSGIADLAFSALEMAPGVRLASPYVKKLIKIIANKANKAAPVDETKRKLMQGGLAAPIVASSGILSQLPIGKINEVVPVIKAVGRVLPADFSIASLKDFKKGLRSAKANARNEWKNFDPEMGEDIINQLDEMSPEKQFSELEDTGHMDVEALIKNIKQKYPGASTDEILKLFPSGSTSRASIKMIDPNYTFVEHSKKAFGNKEDAIKELNLLRKKNPNVEFTSLFSESRGHQIYFKKLDKDVVTYSNRKKFPNAQIDDTLWYDPDFYIPSSEAPV